MRSTGWPDHARKTERSVSTTTTKATVTGYRTQKMIDGQAGLKEHSEFQMLPVDDLPRRFVAQVPVTKTGEIGNRRRPDLGDHGTRSVGENWNFVFMRSGFRWNTIKIVGFVELLL